MYEIDNQKFGRFVAALRKEKGYTQKELAEKLFLSDKAISKWERGVSPTKGYEKQSMKHLLALKELQ